MVEAKKRSFFRPATRLGLLSIILILISFFLVVSMILVGRLQGPKEAQNFTDNLPIFIPGVLMMISGISSFVVGLISIIKKKERSIFVFISTFMGMILLWFLIGEIFFEH